MSRDFRFRAWDKKEEKMIYDIEIECDGLGLYFIDYLYDKTYEVMQYIGLKDKNGEMVFDGDIVLIGDNKAPFKIIYCEDQACFNFVSLDKLSLCLLNFDNNTMEVIGNIYENPELLNPELAREKLKELKDMQKQKELYKKLFGE